MPNTEKRFITPQKVEVILKLTSKEFDILNRAVNPKCRGTKERNLAFMFAKSLTARHASFKEVQILN